MFTDRII